MLFSCTISKVVGTLSLRLLWLASLTLSLNAGAQTADTAQAQRDAARARIVAERQAIEQRRSQQEVACYQRFAVEDCLRAVRTAARTEDNALRRQELEINDIERREKSAERLRSIEQKKQEPRAKAPVDGKLRSPKAASAPTGTLPNGPSAQELLNTQALRAQQARERAQAQSQHQQSRVAEQARKQGMDAERRAAARERYEAKQLSAQQRRQRAKAQEDGKPKALPLPTVDH